MKAPHPFYFRLIPILLLFFAAFGCRQIRQAQRDLYRPVVTAPDGPEETDSAAFHVSVPADRSTEELFAALDGWLGVPYRFGGTTKSGVDCSGLVMNVMRDAWGIVMKRSSGEMLNDLDPIGKEDLRPGDLIFFKIGGRQGYHVGIYTGQGRFVHASTTKGVMMSGLDEPYFIRHYYQSGRIKKHNP